jgi:hypothetical protein
MLQYFQLHDKLKHSDEIKLYLIETFGISPYYVTQPIAKDVACYRIISQIPPLTVYKLPMTVCAYLSPFTRYLNIRFSHYSDCHRPKIAKAQQLFPIGTVVMGMT